MKKSKQERDRDKVNEFKFRFIKENSETLKWRLNTYVTIKEAAIAIREILEERGEQ